MRSSPTKGLLLAAAVEEERDVRVLLGLSDAELRQGQRFSSHSPKMLLKFCGPNATFTCFNFSSYWVMPVKTASGLNRAPAVKETEVRLSQARP